MTDRRSKAAAWDWMSPSAERLQSKFTNLKEKLQEIETRPLKPDKGVVATCSKYLGDAEDFLNRPSLSPKFPFFRGKHPHLVWEFLHRVDENLILLMSDDELSSRAVEVKSAFDLNIKEEKIRAEWIGPKGILIAICDKARKEALSARERCSVKEALQLVNEQMDRTFWQLSANTLTSVWSAVLLGLLILLAWQFHPTQTPEAPALASLGTHGLSQHYWTLIMLGLMGAYVSNLLTKEDFLYVRGAPFLRYWLYNLFAKPVIGAFAAIFIFILEKSKLLFSITPIGQGVTAGGGPQLISFNVTPESSGYVFAVLALASAFAADKLLRSTFDSVLKRLEQRAEKTKDAGKG